jgi:hypothetical protein
MPTEADYRLADEWLAPYPDFRSLIARERLAESFAAARGEHLVAGSPPVLLPIQDAIRLQARAEALEEAARAVVRLQEHPQPWWRLACEECEDAIRALKEKP